MKRIRWPRTPDLKSSRLGLTIALLPLLVFMALVPSAAAMPPARSLSTSLAASAAAQAPGLVVDRQVATHQSAASSSISSPPMTTSLAGELILAFIMSDGSPTTKQSFSSVTGGGLSWSLRKRSNARNGTSEIWQAVAPTAVSNMVVKANRSSGAYPGSIVVAALIGASTTLNGATGAASGRTGAPTATLSPTKTGSWVWGVGTDLDRAVARTVGANQTKVDEYLAPAGDTFWVQRQTAPNTGGSLIPVTINDTAPTNDRWNLAIIEIPPATPETTAPTVALTAPASGNSVSGTITVSAIAADNVGVVGVQFQVDGINIGAADTTAPYSVQWNTTTAANGTHTHPHRDRHGCG